MKRDRKVSSLMKARRLRPALKEIGTYDLQDTSVMIDQGALLKFENLGLTLPKASPTQVISIRLPSALINRIRALGSSRDIPYQILIKLFLAEAVEKIQKKAA
jgi:hypothetical protein